MSAFKCAVALVLLIAPFCTGCVGHEPALRQDQTARIPGRETIGLSGADARQKVLRDSAKLTINHGFRYFLIVDRSNPLEEHRPGVSPTAHQYSATGKPDAIIVPGADVTIRILKTRSSAATSAKVWDAYEILTPSEKASAVLPNR